MSQPSLFGDDRPVHAPTRDFFAGMLAYHATPPAARGRKLSETERAKLDAIATDALQRAQDALVRLGGP